MITITACMSDSEKLSHQAQEFVSRCEAEKPEWREIYSDLQNWLLTDSTTIGFYNSTLSEHLGLHHVTSEDGKISLNAWFVEPYKTMNVIQIQGKDGFRSYDKGVIRLNDREPLDDVDYSTNIFQVRNSSGETIYLIKTVGGSSSDYDNERVEIAAFRIIGNDLVPAQHFFKGPHANKKGSLLEMYYNRENWGLRTRNTILTEIPFSYEASSRIIRLPQTDNEERVLDNYYEYRFNGKSFVYSRKNGNPMLHASLKGYKEMVYFYEAEHHFIRIDVMPDDTYRYVSWLKHNKQQTELYLTEKPKLVLTDGVLNRENQLYTFINGSYIYKLPVIREIYEDGEEEGVPYSPYLIIEQKGKEHARYEIYY